MYKLFPKIEKEGTLPKSLHEASITRYQNITKKKTREKDPSRTKRKNSRQNINESANGIHNILKG